MALLFKADANDTPTANLPFTIATGMTALE
jgi:hypothetical protein